MEKNFTLEQGLIRESSNLESIPGYHLVLFKETRGGGKSFRDVIGPGDKFKRKITEIGGTFSGFLVPDDRDLSFEFKKHLLTIDQVHSFTLSLTIRYEVLDPRLVVEKKDFDPLGRVRAEALRILGPLAAGLPWVDIVEGRETFKAILSQVDPGGMPAFERLKQYSERQGILISGVGIGRNLPDTVPEPQRREEEARNRLHKQKIEQALAEDQAAFETGMNQRNALINAATNAGTTMVSETNTPQALGRILEELKGGPLQPSSAMDWFNPDGPKAMMPAEPTQPARFQIPSSLTTHGLPKLLSDALDMFSDLEPGIRRPLFSALLLTIGNLLATEQDEQRLEDLSNDLQIMKSKKWVRTLERDQVEFLRLISNMDGLRSQLKDW